MLNDIAIHVSCQCETPMSFRCVFCQSEGAKVSRVFSETHGKFRSSIRRSCPGSHCLHRTPICGTNNTILKKNGHFEPFYVLFNLALILPYFMLMQRLLSQRKCSGLVQFESVSVLSGVSDAGMKDAHSRISLSNTRENVSA